MNVISPKKLIEVALPLDAINAAAASEKGNPFLKGHPRNLHQWWARRPLAAARAVIFAQLVHDPEDLWRCQNPGQEPTPQVRGHWTKARGRLFRIIEELVAWENTTNESVLNKAREAIRESWRQTCDVNKCHPDAGRLFNADKMPGLYDPFAGGGAIPLEAQRLGLEVQANDLNPVAVLINKAMIEVPPKFAGRPPVHPEARSLLMTWTGAAGLAEDLRRYGEQVRDMAAERIGHLYPKIEITKAMVEERPDLRPLLGRKLTIMAWLWARTVKSPNPAFAQVDVPLVSTFSLSTKAGKESFVQPIIGEKGYRFTVKVGKPPAGARVGTSAGKRQAFRCLMSDVPIPYDYIREEGRRGRMGQRLMAIVAEGVRGRVFLSPSAAQEKCATQAEPSWKPNCEMPKKHRNFQPPVYGMNNLGDLFTPRQLVALTTLSDLVGQTREQIHQDAVEAGLPDDDIPLEPSGTGARAYADSMALLLAMALSKSIDYTNTLCAWNPTNQNIGHLFTRHAVPMTWDFAEMDPISGALPFNSICDGLSRSIEKLPARSSGRSKQADCRELGTTLGSLFISTDPPYYDNISYADLSDFFYVWLRRSLKPVFPKLLATISVPKAEELVASPHRHGTRENAESFFLDGMKQAIRSLAAQAHPAVPVTIYYAFKQAETEENGTNSTGWETFMEAVLSSGLSITGTWPMRTERTARSVGRGTNVLASSIILVCRPRAKNAAAISRRQFVRLLNEALPAALDAMTRESEGVHSPVAPVDLSQAIIGPGMAIFSRYDAVLEADGTPMSVKTALQLINRFLAEDDFDPDTQFCLHWFEQHGWETGKFGEADTLARAKGTSVDGVKQAGVIHSGGGSVRLLRWKDYPADWDPESDSRLPVWEALHQLLRAHNTLGDSGAATVLAATVSRAEAARQLAYRLYTLCERRGWAEDARAYNEIVTGWSGIEAAAIKIAGPQQGSFLRELMES